MPTNKKKKRNIQNDAVFDSFVNATLFNSLAQENKETQNNSNQKDLSNPEQDNLNKNKDDAQETKSKTEKIEPPKIDTSASKRYEKYSDFFGSAIWVAKAAFVPFSLCAFAAASAGLLTLAGILFPFAIMLCLSGFYIFSELKDEYEDMMINNNKELKEKYNKDMEEYQQKCLEAGKEPEVKKEATKTDDAAKRQQEADLIRQASKPPVQDNSPQQ